MTSEVEGAMNCLDLHQKPQLHQLLCQICLQFHQGIVSLIQKIQTLIKLENVLTVIFIAGYPIHHSVREKSDADLKLPLPHLPITVPLSDWLEKKK